VVTAPLYIVQFFIFNNVAKHKYIETPEKMWELFTAYYDDVKSNPRKKVEYVGRNGDKVETPLEVPLTMVGFECYVFNAGYNQELSYYFANRDDKYTDYLPICSRIRKAIRQDQIEGGMVGQYNASITQRLNGLQDKQQIDVKAEQPLFPDVSTNNGNK
jgi:hypothetical protein